jgi:hypothetical protein
MTPSVVLKFLYIFGLIIAFMLYIVQYFESHMSNLFCHGSCSLRGTGGDLVLLEEAAFIPQDVWLEVVIPLIVRPIECKNLN